MKIEKVGMLKEIKVKHNLIEKFIIWYYKRQILSIEKTIDFFKSLESTLKKIDKMNEEYKKLIHNSFGKKLDE